MKTKKEEQMKSSLHELFLDELKDIYYAENLLAKTLPEMAEASTAAPLKKAFQAHLKETQNQIKRLEQVFKLLDEKAEAKKCDAMEGLIKEAKSLIKDNEAGLTRDVGIIIGAQKVEHYEIAAYGSLATLADLMGHTEVKKLLGETLVEEKATDEKLTEVALNFVNEKAAAE